VNYAGALSFEVWGSAGQTDTTIRMRFKNGSADTDFARYPWLNTDGDVPLQQVLDQLQPAAIADTAAWCGACGNSVDRGCGALALAASRARGRVVNNVAAGAIGAGVALALAAAILALLSFFGLISFGRSRYARRRSQGSTFNKRNSGADDAYPLGVSSFFYG
jgi:prostatic aicd phosphatase